MRTSTYLTLLAVTTCASAYPFMAEYNQLNAAQKRAVTDMAKKNLLPRGAESYSSQYPYGGAKINGLPGSQVGNVQVPAPGDAAHQYQDPPPGAFRGPCPGLNAAANHGFLSRDGIVTFNELVAAQQNVYNVGYDLAVTLATLGVGLDGDLLTGKLSLGAKDQGLAIHGKFEADASLTRNDYYTNGGDDFSFNGTLFGYMANECNGNFDRDCMTRYRKQRYDASRSENGQFVFLPTALLLYGASSFLYTLMPTNGGPPDLATISSFFGAKSDGNGGWTHVPERIPDNWFSRATPYTGTDVVAEILAQYLAAPVAFGGNVGKGNFVGLDFGPIKNGQWSPTSAADVGCLLQQAVLAAVPQTIQGLITAPLSALQGIAGKINPIFAKDFGCPAVSAS